MFIDRATRLAEVESQLDRSDRLRDSLHMGAGPQLEPEQPVSPSEEQLREWAAYWNRPRTHLAWDHARGDWVEREAI